MMKIKEGESLAYDDVLIEPNYSEILPSLVNTECHFSKNIALKIPLISAAMDTVTESKTAIVMAQLGGIGVIHKNMSIEKQAEEINLVKKYEWGMIFKPVTLTEDKDLFFANELMGKYKISGFPVVDEQGKLIGILTNRDIRFQKNFKVKVKDVMTSQNLVTAQVGTSLEEAKNILQKHRIEKLPVVDGHNFLKGLITIKDIEKSIEYPYATRDSAGRLRVAAAIGVSEVDKERAEALFVSGVDALVVDTAHGHSKAVIEMIKYLKKKYNSVDIVAGNVSTLEACQKLVSVKVDAIKIGGAWLICTTRIVAGVGVPQLQAVMDCAPFCQESQTPLIADGGIKYSGDIVKALAAGASTVMLGSLLAGTDESPGEMILFQGRAYKVYRGMGSLDAMKLGSKDRYAQGEVNEATKLVPEGIEGQIAYRGKLADNIFQLIGGLRSGMGNACAKNLAELFAKSVFRRITSSALKESHPHGITITKEAPNYKS